ncbi:hypothetical protein N9Q51_00225 [Flavobacteriaceae bacterium]|nr:hypothetical protein [Flavobacteriaceae bacterium]
MDEKQIFKYFDLVIKNIDDVFAFSINNILFEYLNPKNQKEKEQFFEIVDEVKYFGKKNRYFDQFGKDDVGWFRLTDSGIELKDSKKGYLGFKKSSNKKPLDWYKIIAIILTVIFGSFNLYQKYDYNNLKTQYNFLRTINENIVNNILLKNGVYKVFSNPNKKDKFTISIIGESILEGEMVFKIIDFEGTEILNESYPSNVLINGYIFDEKSTSKELEEYIKKRVSEFFKEDNFSIPALSIDSKFDSDYSVKKNWTDIKSDSSAVGFYYLIGLENGCRISYSKKQKQVLKYFCCC